MSVCPDARRRMRRGACQAATAGSKHSAERQTAVSVWPVGRTGNAPGAPCRTDREPGRGLTTYRGVDDDATILVECPSAQGIIQASWNWPFDRKDMEVCGRTGQIFALRGNATRVRLPGRQEEQITAPPLPAPEDDFLNYLAAVVRKGITPSGLSSLENNMIVTEILDAARRSAATGQRIPIK